MNRNHIILVLMVLIASAPFLLPAGLMVQRAIAIHEMKEKLESTAVQVVQLDASSVKWYRQDKECWINNRLFDVKEIRIQGDKVYLTGLFDDQENNIMENMASVSAPLPQEKERSHVIFQVTHLDIENNAVPERWTGVLFSSIPPVQNIYFTHSFNQSVFLPPELI